MDAVRFLKRGALLGTMLIALACLAPPSPAQQGSVAQVTVGSAEVVQGGQVTIAVTVETVPGSGLASFQGVMGFNPSIIEITQVTFTERCPVHAFNVRQQNGLLRFAATTCGDTEDLIKDGELFRMTIRAVGSPGSSATLSPAFEIFHDADSRMIPHQVSPGTLRIVEEVNQAPTADFEFTPARPAVGDTVRFQDRSRDPDGQIQTWQWDFGDGSTATEQNPSHAYAEAGTYTVKLTVTDDGGKTASRSKEITVVQAPAVETPQVTHFPNPAKTRATFRYALPDGTTAAHLLVFNLEGRLVFDRNLDVNGREFVWDLKDSGGRDLPNGPYFYLVRAATPKGVLRSGVEVLIIQR